MNRTTLFLSTMALVAELGCGGQDNQVGANMGGDASASGLPDATSTSGDARDGASDAISSVSCASMLVDAAGFAEGDARVPLLHRPTGACCPAQRGPGPSGQPYSPGFASPLAAGGCTSDSDCKAGVNGRCFPFEGLVGPGGCSYDECFTDSSCGSKTPCVCRGSSADDSANVCDPGGDCAVDSDCGPGGYCSPSWGGCGEPTYLCHTASDACIDDADCPSVDAGGISCPTMARCAYDPQAQHWACSQLTCCPL